MVFKSELPDIDYPTDLTVWEFVFGENSSGAQYHSPVENIAGFTNGLTKERLDFLQVKENATFISTALVQKYGLRQGDTVSLFSNNTVWYPVAMFALLRVGGRVIGASPAYTTDEMSHALRTSEAKYLMTVPSSIEIATAAAKTAGIPNEHVFLLEGQLKGFTTVKELMNYGKSVSKDKEASVHRIPRGKSNHEVCGFLNFSSGTTGLPKAVMVSHGNVIAQMYQLKAVAPLGPKKFLAQTPLFHISGLVRFLMWPIVNNDECVMLPQFDMEIFLKTIVEYQIPDIVIVPPLAIRLVQDPIVDKYDLSCIKRLACSSAPLSSETLKLLEKKLPWAGFRQSYGMTETCGTLSTHTPEFYSFKYARSNGKLIPSTRVKVIDVDSGKDMGPNQRGEIYVQGPQNTMGYLHNPKATSETYDADGFVHTGDIGYFDDEGFLYIVDRIKELIKVKGQQVAPAELEDLLISHKCVAEAAVLGIPDDYSGERPKAYIVLESGHQPSESIGRELIKYVQGTRVRYKWLKEVEFIDAIPKNASGKILRRVLRMQAGSESNNRLVVKDYARAVL